VRISPLGQLLSDFFPQRAKYLKLLVPVVVKSSMRGVIIKNTAQSGIENNEKHNVQLKALQEILKGCQSFGWPGRHRSNCHQDLEGGGGLERHSDSWKRRGGENTRATAAALLYVSDK
jgi:hypothetical protein